ncbi:MAG TPA: D-alanyl-D-alanine carboxypeptidase family protein [Acidimicrobiales bacterium]|nr:D-alanyl-D-alanine carboxypeptidase family protein [Acidimicrobiales bacterium]
MRATIVAAVAAATLSPAPGWAQEPSAEEQLDDVRSQAAAVAAELDVIEAEDAEIQAALATIQTNVAGQQVVVNAANDAAAVAEADLAASQAAIDELEAEIVELDAAADQVLIDAYIDPPLDHALDVFKSETLADATVKTAIVELQTQADTDAIEELDTAQSALEVEKAAKEELAATANAKKAEADAAMAELETALAQQTTFATEVEERLNTKLSEAQALAASDAALSQQILAEQAAVAAALQAAEAQPSGSSSTISPAPGGLATVTCPSGGSITVAGSISSNVQSLLDASFADGVSLCGGGYRDPQQQIELRKAHCGTSYYAIYEMPSSQCNPPTARPGSSMHEQGLAIDFTCNGGGTVSTGSSCWDWLSANANSYGLFNLPSESWHWSTNGN